MAIVFLDQNKLEKIKTVLNGDPEFKIAARYLSADVLLKAGAASCVFKIREGLVNEIRLNPVMEPYSFSVVATAEAWEKLLLPVPPPYYNEVFAGMQQGTFMIEGDLETAFAYLRAINRQLDLLRKMQNS